jgi:hypothetical protein
MELSFCGEGTNDGVGAILSKVSLFEQPSNTKEKIVNGDFSKNACPNSHCIWSKSDYNN